MKSSAAPELDEKAFEKCLKSQNFPTNQILQVLLPDDPFALENNSFLLSNGFLAFPATPSSYLIKRLFDVKPYDLIFCKLIYSEELPEQPRLTIVDFEIVSTTFDYVIGNPQQQELLSYAVGLLGAERNASSSNLATKGDCESQAETRLPGQENRVSQEIEEHLPEPVSAPNR